MPGVSEAIVLKDGTRIKVKEELLEDGTRRITREIEDTLGNTRIEAESFRGPFDDESFLSLEEQQLQKGHHDHDRAEISSTSSGWDSRMGDLVDTAMPHEYPYNSANESQTSGWISQEKESGASSTFYTGSRSPKYDDGLALSPSRKYHAAPRKYDDRLATSSPPSPSPPSHPPGQHRTNFRTDVHHLQPRNNDPLRDYHGDRFSSEDSSIEDTYQHTLGIAQSRSLRPKRSASRKQSSLREQRPPPPRRGSPARKKSSSKRYQHNPRQQAHSSIAADRFSRHVDPEFMISNKIFPTPTMESDLTDEPTFHMDGNHDGEKKGAPPEQEYATSRKLAGKTKKKWCNTWVMVAICVLLLGAIAGLVFGWLVPMLSKDTNGSVSSSSTQGEAVGIEPLPPTPSPTSPEKKSPDDSTISASPTSEVPWTKRPTMSPTWDPCSDNTCEWTQLGKSLVGDNFGDAAGTSTALSANGSVLAIGGVGSADTGGFAKIFVRRGSSWVQRGQTIEGPNKYDRFGLSVALSADGHTAAIGGDGWDGEGVNRGVVRVYKYNRQESEWVQLGTDFEGDDSFDRVGWSVSLSSSGRVLAYGAPGSDTGSTRVFHWNGSRWKKRGGDIKMGERSGHSIDLSSDGHVLAIGSTDGSYASVYEWIDNAAWRRRGEVLVGRSNSSFGAAVKLSSSGDIVAVGSPNDGTVGPDSGVVKIFSWNNIEWESLGTIYGSFDSDYAGSAIALDSSGFNIAVGSPGRGDMTIYEWRGSTQWVSKKSFSSTADTARTGGMDTRPVFSVALSSGAKFAAIGLASAGDSGAVTVYQFAQTVPSQAAPVAPTSSPTAVKVVAPPPTAPKPTQPAPAPTLKATTNAVPAPTSPRPTRRAKTPSPTRSPSTSQPTKVPKPTRKPTSLKPTRAPIAPTRSPTTARPTAKPTFVVWNQLGETIYGEESGEYIGTSTSLSAQGNTLAMGGTWDGFGLGIVRIYVRDGTSWSQLGQTLEGSRPGDHFGAAVKLSNDGRTILVGSDLDSNTGSVRIYRYSDSLLEWVQLGSKLQGSRQQDQAGWSVAMSASADVVAFGAPGSSKGYTRVYRWNGNRWVRKGGDINNGDRSGHSIAFNGDGTILAVGALDGSYVKVYKFDGSSWNERGTAITGEESSYFGASVSLSRSGNELAIGAPYDTRIRTGSAAGLARVYVWDANSWVQKGQDLYGMSSFYYFGQSVSLASSGQVLAVGSPGPRWGDVPSKAHVFDWDNSSRIWILRGDAISSGDSSAYGTSSELPSYSMAMSLSGKTVAIAAPFNGDKGRAAGFVKVYQWPG